MAADSPKEKLSDSCKEKGKAVSRHKHCSLSRCPVTIIRHYLQLAWGTKHLSPFHTISVIKHILLSAQ